MSSITLFSLGRMLPRWNWDFTPPTDIPVTCHCDSCGALDEAIFSSVPRHQRQRIWKTSTKKLRLALRYQPRGDFFQGPAISSTVLYSWTTVSTTAFHVYLDACR